MSDAGSELCRACGLCCDGTLFDTLRLTDDEARDPALALPVLDDGGRPAVRFPCPAHRGGCTIYAARPSTCQAYRCNLLDRVESDELDLAAAMARVREVRARVASLHPRMPDAAGDFWAEVARLDDRPRAWKEAHAALLLDLVTLRETLRCFFDERTARRLVKAR